MEESVVVRYPGSRVVYVDNDVCGETNRILVVQTGRHVFALGEPRDYRPTSVEEKVEETTATDPLVIVFRPKRTVAKSRPGKGL